MFNIDEVSIYDEGTKQDHTYAVSGEIMDGVSSNVFLKSDKFH